MKFLLSRITKDDGVSSTVYIVSCNTTETTELFCTNKVTNYKTGLLVGSICAKLGGSYLNLICHIVLIINQTNL